MTDAARAVEDLHLQNLTKRFGDFVAVDDLTLTIPAGSFFALLGASGCGKTTTLRMVAGLEDPTEGSIRIGEKDITGLRAFERPVNTVFQSYALFPHLDIFENVAFGLRRRGIKDVKPAVEQMLDLVELGSLARRKPSQLSGGQQQRVAVARALINEPDVLLLDEPLGALDLKLRRQMQIELKRIQMDVGTTFVHVTHDQEEAMTMADTVAVMNAGRIEQMGHPADIYETPQTVFVANFLGQSNLIDGRRTGTSGEFGVIEAHGLSFMVPSDRCFCSGSDVTLGVRPEKITVLDAVDAEQVPDGHNRLEGRVTDVSYTGVSTQYLIDAPWGQELIVFEQNVVVGDRCSVGDPVILHWAPSHTFGLDPAPGRGAGIDPEVIEAERVNAHLRVRGAED
ncbi:MAG: ABC transporter ATP-binding protein [Candidatus Nanopelagicales bacterium]|nr:ABC transporter ATP-binding protein [Candidatus Nanopelagicales bacterium]MCF8537849.1 ABC transporter ATP-binding protein [Candidatus Nanopelagicales bacterium]MCF8543185.1 ABC transporter ATP-binding protein [Candidatus Nanopelagicales bacterium]MCF8557422.1 ABC transporter ATP-binding protein [Candidatus Nanopelagicales bacterium]